MHARGSPAGDTTRLVDMAAAPAPRLANATATTPAAPGSGSVGGRASERHDRAHGWLDAVSGVVAGGASCAVLGLSRVTRLAHSLAIGLSIVCCRVAGVTRTVVAPLDVVKIRQVIGHAPRAKCAAAHGGVL